MLACFSGEKLVKNSLFQGYFAMFPQVCGVNEAKH